MMNAHRYRIPTAVLLAGGLVLTSTSMASAAPTATNAVIAPASTSAPTLTEAELAEVGLTREDADAIVREAEAALAAAEARGEITAADAAAFRQHLLTTGSGGSGEVSTQALPVWAAAAIIGCAGSVMLGEGADQVKNALRTGGVDSATDIALGIGVDCVFGAVPGGAIGAAAKKTLTQPIKDTLRPAVKKVIETFQRNND
ncbi:hypothetical protein [Clavibacter zhangzhiyongii]|uniref:Secreted protein n=1 Tax=Clavibacter zhangzhiyongii TaxID=2768071 RepID=A0A7L7YYW4_9MICO|nr:hypothetical protein [Clavibacter zhangzhiyongii]QOD42629.1 hypothetical protein H9X71_08195 [Clavibacter zhangzhiyongii]